MPGRRRISWCRRGFEHRQVEETAFGHSRGDPSALPLYPDAVFLENMLPWDRARGPWSTRLPVADAISFHDPRRCKSFTQTVVTEGGHPYVIGTRLYLNGGKVIRVDSLVTERGDRLFNADACLKQVQTRGLEPAVQIPEDRRQ